MIARMLTVLLAIAVLSWSATAAGATQEHIVRRGETLSSIAARYNVTVQDLVAWNRIEDPDRIREGQRLVVAPAQQTYVVKKGDTLQAIARAFGTDVRRLAAWNGLEDPNRLYPGQVLVVVPGPVTRHVVQPGETLWQLARSYGVPVDALAESNGIRNPQKLRVGQQLTIPVMATGGPSGEAQASIARPGTSARDGQITLIWPLRGRITSRYGPRWGRVHYGLDIAAPQGTPVRAAAAGVVTFAGWAGTYGRMVLIDHGGGVQTRYAHHSAILVKEGERVRQGQVIAQVGSTGHSTGPHLHFEVLINGQHQDPEDWLPRR